MTDEKALAQRIVAAWDSMPIPPVQDLAELHYEFGARAYGIFADNAVMDVDRQALDEGSFMLFMPPYAALTYLGAFMLAVLDNMPVKREGCFVFDQLLMTHLFGQLADLGFLQTLVDAGLSVKQAAVVDEFVAFCLEEKDLLQLDDDECGGLRLGQKALELLV